MNFRSNDLNLFNLHFKFAVDLLPKSLKKNSKPTATKTNKPSFKSVSLEIQFWITLQQHRFDAYYSNLIDNYVDNAP